MLLFFSRDADFAHDAHEQAFAREKRARHARAEIATRMAKAVSRWLGMMVEPYAKCMARADTGRRE